MSGTRRWMPHRGAGPRWGIVRAGVRCAFGHSVERGAYVRFGAFRYGQRAVTCGPCWRKHYGQAPPPEPQTTPARDGKRLALGEDE